MNWPASEALFDDRKAIPEGARHHARTARTPHAIRAPAPGSKPQMLDKCWTSVGIVEGDDDGHGCPGMLRAGAQRAAGAIRLWTSAVIVSIRSTRALTVWVSSVFCRKSVSTLSVRAVFCPSISISSEVCFCI